MPQDVNFTVTQIDADFSLDQVSLDFSVPNVTLEFPQSLSQVAFTAEVNAVQFILSGNTGQTGFPVIPITEDYTISSNAIILCNNSSAIDIILGSTNERMVYIKRRDALVNLIGTVDGVVNPSIVFKWDSTTLVYSTATGEWSTI